jgi:D-sedoheptulose 7-phosphate isomerase
VIDTYLRDFTSAVRATQVTPYCADPIATLYGLVRTAHIRGNTTFLVGNGGSAAIASHTATDLCKNAGLRARALNDASALTCIANDYGYEEVFAKQIGWYGRGDDLLIVISSSGKSHNILGAAYAARDVGISVVTFSGFEADNPLRKLGELNFYVPSNCYGFVEMAHQLFLHALIDGVKV